MMRLKLLGRSGLRVSELALGTMTFGEDWGWGASRETSRAIFDAYTAAGGNFIDTSINYTNGTAEKFVGEFIASQRDYYVVATKYTLNTQRDNIMAAVLDAVRAHVTLGEVSDVFREEFGEHRDPAFL